MPMVKYTGGIDKRQ